LNDEGEEEMEIEGDWGEEMAVDATTGVEGRRVEGVEGDEIGTEVGVIIWVDSWLVEGSDSKLVVVAPSPTKSSSDIAVEDIWKDVGVCTSRSSSEGDSRGRAGDKDAGSAGDTTSDRDPVGEREANEGLRGEGAGAGDRNEEDGDGLADVDKASGGPVGKRVAGNCVGGERRGVRDNKEGDGAGDFDTPGDPATAGEPEANEGN